MCDFPVTALETPIKDHPIQRKTSWLRATLARSRRDAMASSTMSGITDNYLGAFAIHLRASAPQIGWLTAAPQLAGAVFQLLSVWLCNYLSRRQTIVTGATLQALAVFGMALVGLSAALRGMIVAWFIPRSVELRIRHRPACCTSFTASPASRPEPALCSTG